MLKNLAFVEIISADNDRYTEEVKQEVLTRYKETPEDWEYILEPIGGDAEMYLKIFRAWWLRLSRFIFLKFFIMCTKTGNSPARPPPGLLARKPPPPQLTVLSLFYFLAMNKKYFAFAVRSSKVVTSRTGVARNSDVLVYGTKIFQSAKECDECYAAWRQQHLLKLSCVVGFDKKPKIDPITHELVGFYPEESQTA